MNKKYILRKNEDIQNTVKNGNKVVSKYYIVYKLDNSLNNNRYCISVSKKLGKANIRNLLKRRTKDIIQKNNFNNSCDYVIILRNSILNIDYLKMNYYLLNVLKGELK